MNCISLVVRCYDVEFAKETEDKSRVNDGFLKQAQSTSSVFHLN